MSETCKIEGCGAAVYVKRHALCSRHYNRLRTNGTTADGPRARKPWRQRFDEKVIVCGPNDCWEWCGATSAGYGVLNIGGRNSKKERAHRLAWQIKNGPIPSGKLVRHMCHNRLCCNPAHLQIGNQQDNVDDMWKRKGFAPKKLNQTQVLDIRTKKLSRSEYAAKYSVSYGHIKAIQNGRCWKKPEGKS